MKTCLGARYTFHILLTACKVFKDVELMKYFVEKAEQKCLVGIC